MRLPPNGFWKRKTRASKSKKDAAKRKWDQYREMTAEIELFCGPLKDKTVLEVGSGSSGDCLAKYIHLETDSGKVIGTDPALINPISEENFDLLRTDICKSELPDESVDLIVSIACFEHVHDFETALSEMHRILKPGGLLYTKFGPIWSSPWGHHLWTTINGKLFSYDNCFLPPYCHLTASPDELIEHCIEHLKFTSNEAVGIADYIFNCPDQNRLIFSDYEEFVDQSPFKKLFFFGSNKFPLSHKFGAFDYPKTMSQLHEKYPGKSGWTYNTIFTLLQK